jgi:Domain of unknown function (DUF4276)
MRFIEVLCEGSSDVPAIREVLKRRFRLTEGTNFRIHAHRGKGQLPAPRDRLKPPARGNDALLPQLPIKLKNMGRQTQGGFEVAVVVVVDADNDDCRQLKQSLVDLYKALPTKPSTVLFRIAVEETESWFLADPGAVRKAYGNAAAMQLDIYAPDQVCGAWEALARALGEDPDLSGRRKFEWAEAISPHLNLNPPYSPSLASLVSGISRVLNVDSPQS